MPECHNYVDLEAANLRSLSRYDTIWYSIYFGNLFWL